ncbi:putative chromatin target of PRMT1 protein [Helianthus debilis subsp. tardiflorus]
MASLDMSLDDMIKSRRTAERGRGRGGRARRGRGPTGPPRKGPLRVNARPSAFTIAKSFRRPMNLPWQRDLLEESLKAAGVNGLDNSAKLSVSNLDSGVTNEDIRELFSEIGELKRYAIHYDKSGRPNGTAEVMFARRSDAYQALKRYNNVQLDGKPMKIEIVGSKSDVPLSPRVNLVGGVNGQRTVIMMPGVARGRGAGGFNRTPGQRIRGGIKNSRGGATLNGRGGSVGRGRGRGRGQSGGRGRGRGRKPAVDKSADELDKELENYHAMQT